MLIDAEQLHLLAPTDDDGTAPPSSYRVPVLYRCHPCERQTRRPHVWRLTISSPTRAEYTHPRRHPCPTCRQPTPGQTIRATLSAARRCDDRCMYAKGPDCVCSCGGANHGRGFAFALDGMKGGNTP